MNHFFFTPKESPSDTVSSTLGSSDRTLLFSDEFNGTTVDETKWNYCYDNYSAEYDGCTNFGNWEDEWYKKSQVAQRDGNLVLTAERKPIDAPTSVEGYIHTYPFTSGMVSTGAKDANSKPKHEFGYGYYEAKIFIPSGQAIWPAFWILPTDRSWPPEIDFMEVLGQKPNELLATYHWRNAEDKVIHETTWHDAGTDLSLGWHTYAGNWQEGRIDWYLDDKLIKTETGENIPSKKMQIILNLAVGGNLPGKSDASTPDKATMLVDYVRVYDKK
ncbi:MAG: glycoside hydrolase family 16 protein [Candidatus Microsaccharimonas sp.]